MKKGFCDLAFKPLLLASAAILPGAAYGQAPVASASAAAAGPASSEILVTARRREESLQSVPVTVNVVQQAQLEKRGSTSPADLVQIVPGLQQNATTDKSNVDWSIRGQTHTYGTLTQAVVTYFNDVVMPRVSVGEFYDLQNIQVLKGPQGTLFGRVTDGGAVLLRTARPGEDFGGFAEVKIGDYSLRQFQGAIDLPIVPDKILLRLATNINRRDGYTHNLFDGRDLDNVHQDSYRATLVVRPLEGLENTTVVSDTRANENGGGAVLIGINPDNFLGANRQIAIDGFLAQQARGPRTINVGTSQAGVYKDGLYMVQRGTAVTSTTSYKVNDDLTLKNIFGYMRVQQFTGSDLDGLPNVAFGDDVGLGTKQAIFFNDRRLISDETQLQGNLFDGKLDYTLGYYTDKEDTPDTAEQFTTINNSIQVGVVQYATSKTQAIYGHISPKLDFLLPGLSMDLGGRQTWDKVVSDNAQYFLFSNNPIPGNMPLDGQCLSAAQVAAQFPGVLAAIPCTHNAEKFNRFSYNVGINYKVSPDILAYATMKTGYRPGGFNATAGGLIKSAFGPETSNSKEVGVKSKWNLGADVRLRANIALFWDKIKDVQTYVSAIDPNNNIVSTGVLSGVPQKVHGFELETGLTLFRALTLTGNWAHMKGKYVTHGLDPARIAASCPADLYQTKPQQNGLLCPLRELNNLPKDTFTISASYKLDLGSAGNLVVGGDWYHTSSFSPGSQSSLLYENPPYAPLGGVMPGYDIVNLNLSWNEVLGKPMTLSAFVTNVANKAYIQDVTGYLDRSNLGYQAAYYGAPRMYGFSLRYRFGSGS